MGIAYIGKGKIWFKKWKEARKIAKESKFKSSLNPKENRNASLKRKTEYLMKRGMNMNLILRRKPKLSNSGTIVKNYKYVKYYFVVTQAKSFKQKILL